MPTQPFKTRVAAALLLAILVWRDAFPQTKFPSMEELAKIELGRILSNQRALRDAGVQLPTLLSMRMTLPPWEIGEPDQLLDDVIAATPPESLDALGKAYLFYGHGESMLAMARSKQQHGTPDEIKKMARQVLRVLNLEKNTALETMVAERYRMLYSQLVTPR